MASEFVCVGANGEALKDSLRSRAVLRDSPLAGFPRLKELSRVAVSVKEQLLNPLGLFDLKSFGLKDNGKQVDR